jgi:undecaprenyl diphosphate synthase
MEDRKIPNHVAIIMDGNRRWATEKGKSPSMGHLQGSKTLEETGMYIFSTGVKYLSVFAFSTENFKRSEEEVNYLMGLFGEGLKRFAKASKKNKIRIVFSGRREPLPESVLKIIDQVVEETKNNTEGIFNLCVNYGGQYEILDATKKVCLELMEGKLQLDDLDIDTFSSYMYSDLPPVDLMIRTSGEERISNFMLWSCAYAEFYFPKVLFPDFNNEEFDKALIEYTRRDRRFGGINYED